MRRVGLYHPARSSYLAQGPPAASTPSFSLARSVPRLRSRLRSSCVIPREERSLPRLVQRVASDPLNTVQSLLQDVVGTRHELCLFPATQFILGCPVRAPNVAAYGLELRPVRLPVQHVHHIAVPRRALGRFPTSAARQAPRNDLRYRSDGAHGPGRAVRSYSGWC